MPPLYRADIAHTSYPMMATGSATSSSQVLAFGIVVILIAVVRLTDEVGLYVYTAPVISLSVPIGLRHLV